MVLTAMASTMTIPLAADSPPMKATSARPCAPAASGSESTKVSALARAAAPAPGRASTPKYSSPPKAIGNTNRLISSR